MASPDRPAITVVVCSHNGARTLAACLEALGRQTVGDRAQVVVVDDGSTDTTGAIARRCGVEVAVHDENRGLGAARNTGIAMARTPVAFTGADMSFTRSALEAVGLFDPRMNFGSDDEYLCGRIREAFPGPALWFEPEAVVAHHDYTGTLRDLLRGSYAYGRGHARVYLTDPAQRWPIAFPQGLTGATGHHRAGNLAFSWRRLDERDAVPLLYPLYLLGLPLTLRFRWYLLLPLVPLWRAPRERPVAVLVDHLVMGAGVLAGAREILAGRTP